MVVHDMKNPVNAIIGFSQGSPTEKKMKSINLSGHRILNLVNNILDIQRFEEAKVVLNAETFDPGTVVKETVQELQQALQAKSLKVINELPSRLTINADKDLLSRILINLISNAIRYSDTGSDIWVRAGVTENGYITLIVKDEGVGIEAEQLPFIFDKFWYKDAGRSALSSSTGLGLAFCRLAVEAHGGEISAESVLNKGTSVIFTLPVASESPYAAVASPAEEDVRPEQLEKADLDILRPLLPTLIGLKVHEVSAINKLIRELEQQGINVRWADDLQSAVYQGDQKRYNQLLHGLG